MEIGPSLPLPDFESLKVPENDKERDKSKEKKSKKKKGFEALLPERREQEAKKIAESLDRSPLFGGGKEEDSKEQERGYAFLKKPEAADDSDAPLEHIGEGERHEIVSELAHDRKQEVVDELSLAEPGSQEAIEAADVIAELAKIEAEGEILPESETNLSSPEIEDDSVLLEGEGEIFLNTDDEDEKATGASASAATPTNGSAGAGGGSGGIPPYAPSAFGAPTPGGGGGRPQASGIFPNRVPSPNMYTSADVAYYEQQAGVRGFLVGGIVGYLIGRRRGRIKTEKRLLPVQRKLENEVKTIAAQLAERESVVRRLSRERLHTPEHLAERPLRRRNPTEHYNGAIPESRLNLEKPNRIERLGKAIVQAELPPETTLARIKEIPAERVRSMSRNELLEISEKIIVEGTTLRKIYESHLIGEKGLRRLLSEYLAGKDIRKDLRREMVEREIDFERDPILRDKAYQEGAAGRAESTLKQMLEKVGASPLADDAMANVTRLHAEVKEEARRKQVMRRRVADTAMVTVIVVLASLVALLLFSR